jgi:hypothetical protein
MKTMVPAPQRRTWSRRRWSLARRVQRRGRGNMCTLPYIARCKAVVSTPALFCLPTSKLWLVEATAQTHSASAPTLTTKIRMFVTLVERGHMTL